MALDMGRKGKVSVRLLDVPLLLKLGSCLSVICVEGKGKMLELGSDAVRWAQKADVHLLIRAFGGFKELRTAFKKVPVGERRDETWSAKNSIESIKIA